MLRYAALCLTLMSAHLLAEDAYKPLRLYNGFWTSHDSSPKTGASVNHIVNVCETVGRFFACQQTVNDKPPTLIVYLSSGSPGHYFTQALSAELRAFGRGELLIEGDRWTYSGEGEENGKPVYYRTVNVFTGTDHIHFEVGQSADDRNWNTTLSGDEVRTSGP